MSHPAEGWGAPLGDEDRDLPAWSLPRVLHAIGGLARHDALTLERQVAFSFTYLVAVLLVPAGVIGLEDRRMLAGSLGVFALHLVLAALVPWPRLPRWAVLLLPALQLEAVALLWLATPPHFAVYGLLIVVPMLGFGMLPSRLGVWVGVPLAFVVGFVPIVNARGEGITATALLAALYLPVVASTIALALNETTRRLLRRTEALAQARQAQNAMLVRARQDAQELARYAEALRATRDVWENILDAVTDQAIIALDEDGRTEVFNPGAERLLGLAKDRAVGVDVVTFFDPEQLAERLRAGAPDARPVDLVVGAARTGGTEVRDWTMVRADGEPRTTRTAVTRRAPLDFATPGYVMVATDVTEERETSRLKDEFVGLVSHELRTPLSSVLGYVELMREGEDGLSEEQAGYLDVIERNARRLLRLVGDLLLSAQVTAGRFQVTRAPVDLSDVVAAALGTAAPLARDAGVTLGGPDDGGEFVVQGDRSRLGQVVDNLLSNAIKFTPRGGEVAVSLEHVVLADGDRPGHALRVKDSGIGIPPDELDRLFERFFRASSATRRAIPGVGLGLTVTKSVVEAHDGRISVESVVGQGTTFTVLLPSGPSAVQRPPGDTALDDRGATNPV